MADNERANRIKAVGIMAEYFWIYLHKLHEATSERLGEAGLHAIAAGIRRYGHYRGDWIRASPAGCAEGRDALALLRAWDTAELALASPDARLQVAGDGRAATLRLSGVPGGEYFAGKASAGVLQTYWTQTLAGLCTGYDEALGVSHDPIEAGAAAPWTLTWTFSGAPAGNAAPPADPFADAVSYIRVSRRTVGAFSALCMYTARALAERFDATGEKVVRDALYGFGVERAAGMRDVALAEGKPLDFQSWAEIMGRRDPGGSAWVGRGRSHITPGVFEVTCAYCPMAEVWAEEGGAGLDFGYLYDAEVHRGLVEGFHPRGVVAWEKVKTRGDKVCNFRFSIPELVTEADPDWARAQGADQLKSGKLSR